MFLTLHRSISVVVSAILFVIINNNCHSSLNIVTLIERKRLRRVGHKKLDWWKREIRMAACCKQIHY